VKISDWQNTGCDLKKEFIPNWWLTVVLNRCQAEGIAIGTSLQRFLKLNPQIKC
jgi:hypothetical protein